MLQLVVYALLSLITIHAFYRVFRIKWPQVYFAVNDQLSYFVSVSPFRYIVFRFLPPLLVLALVNDALIRDNSAQVVLTFSIVTALIHGLITNGRELADLCQKRRYFRKDKSQSGFGWGVHIALNIATIIILVGVGYLAAVIGNQKWFVSLTPTFTGLIDNIWSTGLVALASVFVYDLYKSKRRSEPDNVVELSSKKIDPDLWKHISKTAKKYQANEKLVKAICITENIQRPEWFRNWEKAKSYFSPQGTYGIMQVRSKKHLTDEESIDLGTKKYFKGTAHLKMDKQTMKRLVKPYNSNPNYFDSVWISYQSLKRK